jgi:TetR/AcrR family transcriptional repressor of mexJK operon
MNRIENFPAAVSEDVPDPRVAQIVEAAKNEFLAKGFAETTMDEIAKVARISKQTLYRHFQDKAELFEAVIVADMGRFRNPPDLTQDGRDPRDVFFEAARWVYDNHVSWTSVSMSKILIGAAGHFAELIRRHHEYRFQSSVSWIEIYIRSLVERGLLNVADPHRAAVRFALMASEGSGPVMGCEPARLKDRERYARMTVAMFLHGVACVKPLKSARS